MEPTNINVILTDPTPLLRLIEILGIWFNGFATIGVVWIAFSLKKYWKEHEKPILEISCNIQDTDDCKYVAPDFVDESSESEEVWLRLRITNKSRYKANNVHLRMLSIQRERKPSPDQHPKWWFKISNLNATSITIYPELPEHFDLIFARNSIGKQDDLSLYLVIVPQGLQSWDKEKNRIINATENNLLEVGQIYTLKLAILGDNIDANILTVKFKVDQRAREDPKFSEKIGSNNFIKRLHLLSINEHK